jgi:predicted N-acyltransferase
VICKLAAQTNADAIVYKEFGQGDLEWMQPLLALGYRRIPTPPMHVFPPSFSDFAQYCAALKTRYRKHINRSTRKLQDTGIALSVLTDPNDIVRVYTPEVHALHHQMVAKAEVKLEVLPIEFFHELALRLNGQVEIIAFGWCQHDASTYHMLYAGLDYRLNGELDLYFNLIMRRSIARYASAWRRSTSAKRQTPSRRESAAVPSRCTYLPRGAGR